MGTGHAGSPSCGRGKGAEHLCLDCMDAQKRQRTPSPPISTGVCLESEGPPLCPSRPRGPSVHDSSMKPREHEELHYGDASLNPSSASCNRKKQSPEPPGPCQTGQPCGQEDKPRCSSGLLTWPLLGCGSSTFLHPKLEKRALCWGIQATNEVGAAWPRSASPSRLAAP